ncbi:MAG TPA: trypsin-like peptidase domain-containing protein [Dehalococcoidia bacterium]|nr:trypsin-like peptidase domain-containing protein [Dehalococcoidia bacterium]
MRQNRPFPPVRRQPEPEPKPPPSRVEILWHRFARFCARFQTPLLIAAGMVIALAALLLYDAAKPPPQRLTQRDINAAVARALASATPKPSYASEAYQVIRPSLVRVQALVSKAGAESEVSLGTGVVIDDSGTILSSLHVVQDAAEVRVTFADGSESEASVILRQRENDLAVLRPSVIPDDLVPATLASSEALRVGDEVFPVGNPFGISNSLSAGVVSGLGRHYKSPKTGDTLTNLIQFDAAVNPGNSGGPLLNRDGEVVGIVTALLNPTEQDVFIGIGFAVTIETASAALGSPPF